MSHWDLALQADPTVQKMTRIREQCVDDRLTTRISLTPEALERAVRIAGELARRVGTNAVRVDFLTINTTHFAFGELTFTSAACAHRIMPRAVDHLLGDASTTLGNTMSSLCFGSLVTLISCGHHMPYSRYKTHCSSTEPDQLGTVVQTELNAVALEIEKFGASNFTSGRKLLSLSAAQSGGEDDHAGLKDEQLVSAFGWVSLFVMGVYLSGKLQSPLYHGRRRDDDGGGGWGWGVGNSPPTTPTLPDKLTAMM